jgi:hypothetical protein
MRHAMSPREDRSARPAPRRERVYMGLNGIVGMAHAAVAMLGAHPHAGIPRTSTWAPSGRIITRIVSTRLLSPRPDFP